MVSLSTKNYGTCQTKLLPICPEVIVWLAEFEEYLAKHGKNSNLEDRED